MSGLKSGSKETAREFNERVRKDKVVSLFFLATIAYALLSATIVFMITMTFMNEMDGHASVALANNVVKGIGREFLFFIASNTLASMGIWVWLSRLYVAAMVPIVGD